MYAVFCGGSKISSLEPRRLSGFKTRRAEQGNPWEAYEDLLWAESRASDDEVWREYFH